MNKEKLGEEYFQLMQLAHEFKKQLNQDKLVLGNILAMLQDFHVNLETEGIEDFGTFKEALAELHLNMGRSVNLMGNARYIKDYDISDDDYKYFDSSILELIRKNKKDPVDYLNDIRSGLSYTDLEKVIKE